MNRRVFLIVAAIAAVMILAGVFLFWRHAKSEAGHYPAPERAVAKGAVTKKVQALPAIVKKFSSPKVTVVMDDLGYNIDDMGKLFAIHEPITFSILPNLKFSKKIAIMARANGYEFILHLPLEPKDSAIKEEFDTIKSKMAPGDILSMLNQEIASVPGVKGVSNHMGSKSTEDKELMSVILKDLKSKNMYFFDSLTSNKSVCADIARGIGLNYAKRDIFLDIPNDEANIRKQILELRKLAFRKGRATAICHYRKNTIKVLNEMMPILAREGIRFVYISEFMNLSKD